MTKQIPVGLVAYGTSGRYFHAPIIDSTPELRLASVVQRHDDSAREDYPDLMIVRSTEELLEDDSIALVVITTPNTTHFELAQMALEAGRHVVVEKPFTPDSVQARKLVALAEEKGKVLSVYQNRRWDGDFLTVRKLTESGVFGRLVEFESRYDRFRNHPKPGDAWREKDLPGSGILFDLGSHLIDQALVLFGMPDRIAADIRRQRSFASADDYFDLDLHYGDDGLKVTLKAGMLVREATPRFRLHGTKASFVKYGMDPQEEALKKGGRPGDEHWGEETEENWGNLISDVNGNQVERKVETEPGCYQAFYSKLAAAIERNTAPPVTATEARNTIRIIELAKRSSEEQRSVPFTPED
ncbi:MAG: oxidoreductase [Balneolaceae bacterium]|nr:oxidoreductase [Balneolaceae bacterium]